MNQLSQEERSVMRRFRAEMEALYPGRIDRILVFGSRARGDSRKDSDLDVAVFLTEPAPDYRDRQAVAAMAADICVEDGLFIHASLLGAERWEEDSFLLDNIRRDAVAA